MITQCPNCSAQFPINNPAIVGQVKPCPKCGKKFRVAEADDWDNEVPTRRSTAGARSTRGKKPSGKNKKKTASGSANQLPLFISIAVGVVSFLAFGTYYLFRDSGDSAPGVANNATGGETATGSPSSGEGGSGSNLSNVQNLQAIVRQMHSFHDAHKNMPHPTKDTTGRVGVSWRVQMLPLLGQQALYDEYHLDEPWDSPHNQTLVARMPDIYQTRGVSQPGFTGLRIVSGKGTGPLSNAVTLFDENAEKGTAFRFVADGTSNTILFVETGPSAAVEWTRPEVIPFDPANPFGALGEPDQIGAFSVVMADGRVNHFRADAPAEQLAFAFLRNDSNPLRFEELDMR